MACYRKSDPVVMKVSVLLDKETLNDDSTKEAA
jgi:hypothetical protein